MTVTIHRAVHVLLVLCLHDAFAQIFGTQTQYNELHQRQLSPIQQGHILSDIQQHQHRFNLNQQRNHLNQPQQFANPQFNPNNFNGPNLIQNQPFIPQQQQNIFQNQPVLSQPPIQPTLVPTSQPIPTQSALPTLQNNAQQNRVVQHLTQTAFSPFKQDPQLSAHQHLFQVTSNPLFNLDERPQDPEKEKQRLKELQEKQSIIEKHNQFVEKQYKKALEKAQEEHADFIKVQQEEKRKLYQKFYKPTGNQGFRYRQNNARYIYPEEKDLFDLAVKKYYEEHPTTTTTTTTTTTPAPPTTESDEDEDDDEPASSRKGKILNQKTSGEIFQSSQSNLYPTDQKSFRPTVLPKVSAIQNLDDLNKLKTQYKSQQIAKDDLIAQLKLAISQGGENDLGKNLTSREIALPNGQRIEIIRTTDPKLVPDAKPIEAGSDLESLVQERFGSQVRLIQDPNQLKSDEDQAALDKLVKEKFNLPDGGDYEIIRTTDPKAIQKKYGDQVKLIQGQPKKDQDQEALDKLVKEKFNLPDGGDYEIIRTNDPKEIQKKYGDQVKLIQPHGQTKKELDQEALDKLVKEKLNLPDGQDYEIIRTTDPKGVPGAIPLDLSQNAPTKPPKEIIQELTKGVVPPGANFEILKQGGNGGLETINGALPDQKKVTFVLLEEQNDGSFKVQGVKGNGEQEKGVDVDSILKKIKDGEIKLPPLDQKKVLEIEKDSIQSKTRYSTTDKPIYSTTTKPIYSTTSQQRFSSTTKRPKVTSTTFSSKKVTKEFIPSVTVTPNSFPSRKQEYSTPILTTNIGTHFVASTTTSDYYNHKRSSTTSIPTSTEREAEDEQTYKSPPNDLLKQASTISQSNRNSIFEASSTTQPEPTVQSYPTSTVTIFKSETLKPQSSQSSQISQVVDLASVLKKNGLYAMAKYLKQSGLDTILNETGPYTLFAPNDKAFRTLLVQLGGPDKAEEKFKENPRLLSGLLLHHVIPGAFKIGSLQDEMTGVSLAGTQLRVNQYNMHDQEWNDVKVTTINGARVLDDRQDIEIPQGLAHGVDRVMFPLPVGDIVQTLQSDRERRFTTFLRALFASGLADTLQGPKTFTLFVPTERAFSVLTREELQRMVSDKALAKKLVLSHLTPGTLYTNGMTYYQLKDSLDPEKQITISKSSGKIKVNNNLIATPNIPATNGVIHAIDNLL